MGKGDDDGIGLSGRLRAARLNAGLRHVDVVARTAVSQAQLSRIEGGESIPTQDQAIALGRLYGLDEVEVTELGELAADERAGIRDERLVVQRVSTLAMQRRWRRIEGQARTIRAYHPVVILGVLQTPAYAAVASRQGVDSAVVRDRMLRHERLLAEVDRTHLLIQTEGSLRQAVGALGVMADQLERIQYVANAPNVEVAIIPATHPLHLLVGSGFHVYDDTAVVIGLEIAAATLDKSDDITHFRGLWERLWAAALHGDDATALLTRIREETPTASM